MNISRRAGIGAATFVAAAAALTACGAPDAGSALTYEGGRITENTLAADAQALADAVGVPVSRSITEVTLNRMATFTLVEQAAQRAGIEVSQGEVDAAIEEQVARFGDRVQLEQAALQQGLLPAGLEEFIRVNLLYTKLAESKATDPAKPQTGEAIAKNYLTEVSDDIALQTNPRFGRWSAEKLQVIPAEDGLTREPDNAPSGTPGGLTLPGQTDQLQ